LQNFHFIPNVNEEATGAIFFMRGNLFFPDPKLSPVDQKMNYAAVWPGDDSTTKVNGGFQTPTGMIIGFVGKA
jgi:hypothetical protein